MSKYMSRVMRGAVICKNLRMVVSTLADINVESADAADRAKTVLEDVDPSDLEDLKDELESWKENLPENLQSSDKAERLETAIGQLEAAIDQLNNVEKEPDASEIEDVIGEIEAAIEDVIGEIEAAIDEADSVEFPGMFG